MKRNPKRVFAIVLRYPESNKVDLYSIREYITDNTEVKMLGYNKEIHVSVL